MDNLSGIADKAEQILTIIDQNAAEKLQKKKYLKSTATDEATLIEVTHSTTRELFPDFGGVTWSQEGELFDAECATVEACRDKPSQSGSRPFTTTATPS